MADPVDAKLLGELAVVVIRAQHLSDRSKIGKHHPYVVLKYGNTKTKTPVVKKGGQHPTFDAEVRFKITEDAEDIMDRPESSDRDSAKVKKTRRIPKNKSMVVTVFADDPKEPKLVGETVVDLSVVFEKCEHDDMFELKYKDMFAGEIYLEMTYFINDAPPIPKKVPKPVSWMDYGTTGPLPPGPARHSSLESRPPDPNLYPVGSASALSDFTPRRESFSGSMGSYKSGAYVPPPTFPGRNATRNSAANYPRIPTQTASAGASAAVPGQIVPPTGWPVSTDSYPHRHSLTGAIPQHGTWQNDPVPYHPSTPGPPIAPAYSSKHGPLPTNTPYPVPAVQPSAFSPTPGYPVPSSNTYTATIPPSSSFPHMHDVAAALPPLPPPPPVEMPTGTSTPVPVWPAGPPRPLSSAPVGYPYAPPLALPSYQNQYQPAAPVSTYGSGYVQDLARPASTNIATYPLIDNRPSSSMGTQQLPQPPERPYSTTSTHYPSAVTSSFHISSTSANSALSNSSSVSAYIPYSRPVPTSDASAGYSENSMQYSAPPSRTDVQPNYVLPTSHSYPEVTNYQQSHTYPPPPPPPADTSSTWMPSDPDSRPGRNYLRSLGVGEVPPAQPPVFIRSPSPLVAPSHYTDQRIPVDPASSWNRPAYPQDYASGGYEDNRPSGFIPPSDHSSPNYHGHQGYYVPPAHPTPSPRY
ncbi:hypothetical protein QFC19_004801 [Naganishia cerealis]|uniref:Uncharacterized protein n=1 Tax=Naganishia cerealis TaxID=610337 RepID=A0ACC2VTP4_9TREE|nr:hypothetical protein QFC19_004801 [Naganishia cerealis]